MRQVIFYHYVNEFGTYLFIPQKVFTVYFSAKEKNAVTLPHSAQRKHAFLGEIKKTSKTKKLPSRREIDLESLNQILSHRSTKLFLSGDTANVWEDI